MISFKNKAKDFIHDLPYKKGEYAGRNWGHAWHSLCSYHGKLKPAIAHFLVNEFTSPGDIVFDPLCGVGTIPFEACLQGRYGIGNDLSRMAYAITKAKVKHPARNDVNDVVKQLDKYIEKHKKNFDLGILPYSKFGFNGKIPKYFERNTYCEILAAREYFMGKDELTSPESMVLAVLLHVLHGNRPYALSRNSHPLTPYAPKGDFIYKNVILHVNNKLDISYKQGDIKTALTGESINKDFAAITTSNVSNVDVIISSPPFAGSIRFYINNWMRLWFVGWEKEDFINADEAKKIYGHLL